MEEKEQSDLIKHLAKIEHNASALSARVANFLTNENQHIRLLNDRLVFYGQNLKNEVENICGRNAYSEDRYRDLFGLIDDCAQQLIPLQALETKYENAVSQLNSLKRPIEASCSDDGKKARLQSETQNGEDLEVTNESTSSEIAAASYFICPFCMQRIHDVNRKRVSNHEIMAHLKCHSGKSFQCAKCNMFSPSKINMVEHILQKHAESKIKYFYNRTAELQVVTVKLQCEVCEMMMKTSADAMDHFTNNHPGECIDFIASTSTEVTKSDFKTFWSRGDYSWNVRQQWNCGHCSHSDVSSGTLLSHHNEKHTDQAISMKLNGHLIVSPAKEDIPGNLIYCCVYCDEANEAISLFDTAKNVYYHWLANHTAMPDVKPFQFYAVQLVACYQCDAISTVEGLKTHHEEKHPDTPFVFVNLVDRNRCGICQRNVVAVGMNQHFEQEHPDHILRDDNGIFNPVRFTDAQLAKLRAISFHQKIKCGECFEIFDSTTELRNHYMDKHPKNKQQIHSFFTDESISVVSSCCGSKKFEWVEFAKHFSGHNFNFECKACKINVANFSEILKHDANVHKAAGDKRVARFSRRLQRIFHEAKVIFGNGLVTNGYNLLGTDYDISHRLIAFVTAAKNQGQGDGRQKSLH